MDGSWSTRPPLLADPAIGMVQQQQPDSNTCQRPEMSDTRGDMTVKQAAVPPSHTGAPIPSEPSHTASSPATSTQLEPLLHPETILTRPVLPRIRAIPLSPLVSKSEESLSPLTQLAEPAEIAPKRKARALSPDRPKSPASQGAGSSPSSPESPPTTHSRRRRMGKWPCINLEPSPRGASALDIVEVDSTPDSPDSPDSPGSPAKISLSPSEPASDDEFSYDPPPANAGPEPSPEVRRHIERVLAGIPTVYSPQGPLLEADDDVDANGNVPGGPPAVPEDEGYCEGPNPVFSLTPEQEALIRSRRMRYSRPDMAGDGTPKAIVRRGIRMRRRRQPAPVKERSPTGPSSSSQPSPSSAAPSSSTASSSSAASSSST